MLNLCHSLCFVSCVLCAGFSVAFGLTSEIRRTHHVFYRGLHHQALLQIKVMAQPGESIHSFHFSIGQTSDISDIRCARLYDSQSNSGFSPHAAAELHPATEIASEKNIRNEFQFKKQIKLSNEVHYFWLVYDISKNAAPYHIIDADCIELRTSNGTVTPEWVEGDAVKTESYARVYPFAYRIVPYYRPRWVKGWHNAPRAVHLTPQHFDLMTDLIHFAYTVSADGSVQFQWVGEGADAATVVDDALREIKRLRAKSKGKARLIAGFGHMDEPMTSAVAHPHTRRILARNMAQWAINRGYEGIDIDWEYPDTPEQWHHFGLFLAALREELAGSHLSVSMASSVTYKIPSTYVTDQLDFIMTMSYDDMAAEHSSLWRFQHDAQKCLQDFHMPRQRIVIGLPFYSNEKGKLTQQFGYSQIRSWYPHLKPSANEFISKKDDGTDGPPHSFNGPDLIREKCRWMKKEKWGGVMIWAYDTDVPLSDKASLGRAVYSVVKQNKAPRK